MIWRRFGDFLGDYLGTRKARDCALNAAPKRLAPRSLFIMAPFLHSWRLKKYSVPPSVKFMVTPLDSDYIYCRPTSRLYRYKSCTIPRYAAERLNTSRTGSI